VPSFTRSLEMALHKALAFANERDQEFATLEHLLLALIDEKAKKGGKKKAAPKKKAAAKKKS